MGPITFPVPDKFKRVINKILDEQRERARLELEAKKPPEDKERGDPLKIEKFMEALEDYWLDMDNGGSGEDLDSNFIYCEDCPCEAYYISTDEFGEEHAYCKNHITLISGEEGPVVMKIR